MGSIPTGVYRTRQTRSETRVYVWYCRCLAICYRIATRKTIPFPGLDVFFELCVSGVVRNSYAPAKNTAVRMPVEMYVPYIHVSFLSGSSYLETYTQDWYGRYTQIKIYAG